MFRMGNCTDVVFCLQDPTGEYVRRWCPELMKLPIEFVHCPWVSSVPRESPFHSYSNTQSQPQLLTNRVRSSGGAGDVSRRRGRRAGEGLSKENRDGPRGRQARGAQGGDRRAKGAPGVRAARRERGVAAARAGSNRAMHHAGGLPNVSLFFIISVWTICL